MQQADRSLRTLTGYQLRRATSAAMPGINKVLEEFGLRRSTYSSLVVIVANPGLNQGQLADALAIERPNVVQIVDQLEEARLVRRTKSAEDRRAYSLQPTSKGCAIQQSATEALEHYDSRLTQGLLEEDKETLRHCLKTIERNVEEMEARDTYEISSP